MYDARAGLTMQSGAGGSHSVTHLSLMAKPRVTAAAALDWPLLDDVYEAAALIRSTLTTASVRGLSPGTRRLHQLRAGYRPRMEEKRINKSESLLGGHSYYRVGTRAASATAADAQHVWGGNVAVRSAVVPVPHRQRRIQHHHKQPMMPKHARRRPCKRR
jgi:hypothetical protein